MVLKVLLDRKQFRKLWNNYNPKFGDWDSPLWIPESSTGKKSRYFVKIRPIPYEKQKEFVIWATKCCRGQILCYSVNTIDQESWYGFSHKNDIVWFLLKWS